MRQEISYQYRILFTIIISLADNTLYGFGGLNSCTTWLHPQMVTGVSPQNQAHIPRRIPSHTCKTKSQIKSLALLSDFNAKDEPSYHSYIITLYA